jgi:ferredoxin
MNVDLVKLVYFSPTGTSKKIAAAIAEGIQSKIKHVDLTPPAANTKEFGEFQDDLTIIAVPVYAGRVPEEAADRLMRLKANDTPAVLVVVYGNRAYEDALLELSDLATKAGFRPVAGEVFIGEHSYSTAENPTAHGRPDAEDLRKAAEFGGEIGEKVRGITGPLDIPPLKVPGNHPYRDGWDPGEPMSPLTEEEPCIKCGRCAEVCPTAAVTVADEVTTEEEPCIMCCACVKSCPTGARVMRPRMQQVSEWLHTNLGERKEPETFL